MKHPLLLLMILFGLIPSPYGMEDKPDLAAYSKKQSRKEGSSITRAVRSVWRKEREAKSPPTCEKILDIKLYLRTKNDHLKALREVFKNAQERIIIASPEVSKKFMEKFFLKMIGTIKNDVAVIFYTSLTGTTIIEEFSHKNPDIKIPVLMTMNSCGIYALMMDSTLFTNGACSFLSLDTCYDQQKVYMTSVVQGENAQIPMDLCLYDLNKAMQKERDDSLISALEVKPLETDEDPLPRPLLFNSTQQKENLDWLEKKN